MNEVLKQFFDSSTIHGLHYISSTRSIARLAWILIVIGGFSVATILIQQSFDNWNENPITTTIETLPISKVKLPNVTVCPPKGTYTNLNYDYQTLNRRKAINETAKDELFNHTIEMIQNKVYKEIIKNMSKVIEEKGYYNWYHGYTLLSLPFYDKIDNKLTYHVSTAASSGLVSTSDFGFQSNRTGKLRNKVEKDFKVIVDISVPHTAKNNETLMLNFDIDKLTLLDIRYSSRINIKGRKIIKSFNR